jgi:hypothetical protein
MKKLYRCPFWDKCDENPDDSDCAILKPKHIPCEHKVPHKYSIDCLGRGILPTCEEIDENKNY